MDKVDMNLMPIIIAAVLVIAFFSCWDWKRYISNSFLWVGIILSLYVSEYFTLFTHKATYPDWLLVICWFGILASIVTAVIRVVIQREIWQKQYKRT